MLCILPKEPMHSSPSSPGKAGMSNSLLRVCQPLFKHISLHNPDTITKGFIYDYLTIIKKYGAL